MERNEAFSADNPPKVSRTARNILIGIGLLGCLLFVSCPSPGSTSGGDVPPFLPEIAGFSIDVPSINVGASQQATVTINVTPGTTVTSVDYEATPANGAIPAAGFWVYNAPLANGQFTIGPNIYVPDCTWGLSQLIVKTSKYIYSYLGGGSGQTYTMEVANLAGAPADTGLKNNSTTIVLKEFTTTGGTPDTTAPQITSVSVSPSAHTFVPGETVTVTVGVSEAGSGIGTVKWANLRPAHMAGIFQSVDLTAINPNTLQGQIVISSSLDAYPLDLYFDLTVGDVSGNVTSLGLDPAGGPNYLGSTIAASDGRVLFAYTPLASRTVANGGGWTAPDSSSSHEVTTVSGLMTIDAYNITGSPPALFFQADTATPVVPADSSTLASIYTAKWPTFSFFWEDGTVANGGLDPALTPGPLYEVNSGYYNPGLRITSVGAHTTLYVFSRANGSFPGTLSEKIY